MRTATRWQYHKRGMWMRVKDPKALRRARERRDLTQRDLALLCHRTQNTTHLPETGGMTSLTEGLALTIAKRLGVDWEDLFDATMPSPSASVSTGRANARRAASVA